MGIFPKPAIRLSGARKRDMPEGLWHKCPDCGEVVHNIELTENHRVCPKCDYHFTLGGRDRLSLLLDPDSFKETDPGMASVDTLKFKGVASYKERLSTYQKRTGLKDAVICGEGKIDGRNVAIAIMDFSFLAATMGSVVGEKITRTIESATKKRLPLIIIAASGGARMYEGMLSLMQMAKTCGALARHSQERLPYISVLTNPTTAGVMASFASVGDVIIAEPKAMVGFAGPRVIKQTTHQVLPEGFQTAEFLQDHGLIDLVVSRRQMRNTISKLLGYLAAGQEK